MSNELSVEQGGERLDKFLTSVLAGASRSKIQKRIAAGAITVNGKTVAPHRLLKTGDRITVSDEAPRLRQTSRTAAAPTPKVLFEDESVLVIDKPAGLTVHPGAGVREPTLVDWLKAHVPGIEGVGDDPENRPGIVHRLDRDVSGVMVIAKIQEAFECLKRQFKDRTVEKEYLALVHGIPKKVSGTIDFRIDRSKRRRGRMTARPQAGAGREARTHYVVERTARNNALLRVSIETGRTHQIRVHLKAIGHPIVGDAVYTTKPYRHRTESLSRPFLHAARLSFTDPDGTRRTFNADLPEELRRYLS